MEKNNQPVVLTLDAGGTNFVFSAIKNYKLHSIELRKKTNAENLENCLNSIISGFKELKESINEVPSAVSFAFPGPADYQKGIIGDLLNLPCFRGGVPLQDIIETEFNLPTFINNDGDLFALGESTKGFLPFVNSLLKSNQSQKQFRNLFGITLGTGFGGGCVIDDRLLLGDNSSSNEIWLHSNKIYPHYNAEFSIGIKALKREYSNLAGINLQDVPEPSELFKIAIGEVEGDHRAAKQAFEIMGKALGEVLADVATLVDGLIVLGGGLSGAYSIFIDSVLRQMNGNFNQFDGSQIGRLPFKVYNLENEEDLKKFVIDDVTEINFKGKKISYDKHRRIGIGKSKLTTNLAISIGAYHFALQQLGIS